MPDRVDLKQIDEEMLAALRWVRDANPEGFTHVLGKPFTTAFGQCMWLGLVTPEPPRLTAKGKQALAEIEEARTGVLPRIAVDFLRGVLLDSLQNDHDDFLEITLSSETHAAMFHTGLRVGLELAERYPDWAKAALAQDRRLTGATTANDDESYADLVERFQVEGDPDDARR